MSFAPRVPIISLITPGKITRENFASETAQLIELVRLASDSGVTMFQVREKDLPARLLFELTEALVSSAGGSGLRIIVNDRTDVALAAGADGVHLPSDSVKPADVRTISKRDLIVGVSAHSVAEIVRAEKDGADYAFFGPVFSTPGKGPALGLEVLSRAAASVEQMPVLALGGVGCAMLDDILNTGASGFAAIRSLNDRGELARLAERIRHE